MVLDDEKYFTYDGSNMQRNDNYYSNDKSKCPYSVRFAGKENNGLGSHYFVHRSPRQSIRKSIKTNI